MIETKDQSAVIYCRVSDTKSGARGDGLHSQETRCREFAAQRGMTVDAVFHDDMTGGRIDRPGVRALLEHLKARRTGEVVVVVDDISRFARDVRGHWDLRDLLREAGGKLMSPRMEFKDDADSRMVEGMMATFAQHQREKNAEQTKDRMRARVQNGYWVFQAPVGYKYHGVRGRGRMLTRDEPIASVVQEALEGYANGRFETQADVMRFLQDNPLFPKDSRGIVRHQRVSVLLNQCCYAGYVEAPRWGITMRPGEHEPLISFETFQRIQERLKGGGYAPRRQNLNEDFPLRGFVLCDDCGTPLTACWSKGSGGRYPYYHCPKRGCDSYGKSIRRDRLEGEFEELLQSVTPSASVFRVARKMFKDLWDHRLAYAKSQSQALKVELAKVESQVGQLLERILDANVPSVIAAYERRIEQLETEKHLIKERIANSDRPATGFEETLRTALDFLSNPWNLWCSGRLQERRTVLKLVFSEKLRYARNSGIRTANLSMPFKVLGMTPTPESGALELMARPKGFEPLTPRFVVWCSIQLSYGRLPI